MINRKELIKDIKKDWETNSRWKGITRSYSAEEVVNLKGSVSIDYSLAKMGETCSIFISIMRRISW